MHYVVTTTIATSNLICWARLRFLYQSHKFKSSDHQDGHHDTPVLSKASRLCVICPALQTGDVEVWMVKMQSTLFWKLTFSDCFSNWNFQLNLALKSTGKRLQANCWALASKPHSQMASFSVGKAARHCGDCWDQFTHVWFSTEVHFCWHSYLCLTIQPCSANTSASQSYKGLQFRV